MSQVPIRTQLLALIALLAVVWTLRAAAMVAIPFMGALLAALTVTPVSARIERRVPRWMRPLGPIVATVIVLAAVMALVAGLSIAASQIASMLPATIARARTAVESGGFNVLGWQIIDPAQLRSLAGQLMEPTVAIARGLLASLANATTGIVLMLFLLLLMLLERDAWHRKIEAGAGPQRWLAALGEAQTHMRRFLMTRLLLGAITGLLYMGWLHLFGVDLLLTWGILALLLNFIPNIGSIIAGVLPAAYAAATKDVGTALVIAAGLLTIEQIMGNYIDPRFMGKQLALSPLVVLASVMLWTWVWGPFGALLSTPLTVLLVDICRAHPKMRPIAFLLGEVPEDELPDEDR